jgi:Sec-independent protein translocase protein TatA
MPNIRPTELIVVVVIALIILGPKRLPAARARSGGACESSGTASPAEATRTTSTGLNSTTWWC